MKDNKTGGNRVRENHTNIRSKIYDIGRFSSPHNRWCDTTDTRLQSIHGNTQGKGYRRKHPDVLFERRMG